jgi:CdiI immunity protein
MIEIKPELYTFFAAWFHPDWDCDDSSSEAVVRKFAACHDQPDVDVVITELKGFVATVNTYSDAELDIELLRIGAYYRSRLEKRSAQAWLAAILRELRKARGSMAPPSSNCDKTGEEPLRG